MAIYNRGRVDNGLDQTRIGLVPFVSASARNGKP
jgi:hypothetical protein